MEIHCKNCGSVIPAPNIDLNRQIAKCERCNSVFNCRDELSSISYVKRDETELPDMIKVTRDSSGLNIVRRWLSSKYKFLVFFAIVWDGFLIIGLGGPIRSGNYSNISFMSVHILAGFFVTYLALAGIINKTRITVNPRSITIRHGPMPGWRNKEIDPSHLKQLYSREFVSYSKRGGQNRSYELHAETKSGKDIKLLADIENKEQALYIEQEIERYLNIKDQLVEDEIPRWF